MRSVAFALYILFTSLISFQIHAHDGSRLFQSETFINGRITEVNDVLVLNVPHGDRMATFRINPELRYFKNQNVSVSGYAEDDHFTVLSVITKSTTWIGKGVGQGIQLQGRIVPRANGGLDFYPVQKRAVDLLNGKRSFQLIFPADLSPQEIYVHLATVRGIITDGKLFTELDYRSFQIQQHRAQVALGDTISWSGTVVGGEGSADLNTGLYETFDFSGRPMFGYEMHMPTDIHVLDTITHKFVPAELMIGGGFSASLAPSVNRVEFLKPLRFEGKMETNHHFLIERVFHPNVDKPPKNLHEALERQFEVQQRAAYASALINMDMVPDYDLSARRSSSQLKVINGDRQRLTDERRCEVELRRSKFRIVSDQD